MRSTCGPSVPGCSCAATGGLVELTHPLRSPAGIPATLRSGLLTPRAVLALARWAGPAVLAPRRVIAGPDRSVRAGLDRVGLTGPLRTEVLEPFLAGVLAEDRGDTSDAFVRLLVRMFALGVPGVPARGIRALPEQLAGRVRTLGVDVRVAHPVVSVSGGAGGANGAARSVELAGGGRVSGRAVVVAVGPDAVAGLTPLPTPVTKGLRTWWFAAPEAPTDSTMLIVDGRRRGPVVNAAVMSNAAPSYAPAGRHLVQVTCLLDAGRPGSETTVRPLQRPRPPRLSSGARPGRCSGCRPSDWELIRRDDIHHALPAQPAPLRTVADASSLAGGLRRG